MTRLPLFIFITALLIFVRVVLDDLEIYPLNSMTQAEGVIIGLVLILLGKSLKEKKDD